MNPDACADRALRDLALKERQERDAVKAPALERLLAKDVQHGGHHIHRADREVGLLAVALDGGRILNQANLAGATLSRIPLPASKTVCAARIREFSRALPALRRHLGPIIGLNRDPCVVGALVLPQERAHAADCTVYLLDCAPVILLVLVHPPRGI